MLMRGWGRRVRNSQANLRNYLYIGVFIFIIMTVTGLISEVSLPALLTRAFLAALFFSVLVGVVVAVGRQFFPPEEHTVPAEQPADEGQPLRGTQVDIVLPAEESIVGEPAKKETVFEPMAPRQIDPKLNKIINEDPERVASMVKKMGLEQ